MKMLVCSDLLLESVCNNIIDVNLSHDWRDLRNEKFLEMINRMENENISYITLLGTLFSKEYVSEKAIDSFFDVVEEHKGITFLLMLDKKEYIRIAYRKSIPNNLHVYDINANDSFDDGMFSFNSYDKKKSFSLYKRAIFEIQENDLGLFTVGGIDENEKIIPHFEAIGYDDLKYQTGFSIIEITPQFEVIYNEIPIKKFSYRAMELTISSKNSSEEIIEYLLSKISDFEYETILHINFVGKVSFASLLDIERIKSELQNKIFYVDISDNTIMSIDEKIHANDISLKSEFIRTAINDDSFEDITRNKILCYGCNALAGKEIHTV